MTTKEFLTANRQEVIDFYNSYDSDLRPVTLKAFMIDLLNGFRKIDRCKKITQFDFFQNMRESANRLNIGKIGVSYSKPYSESRHAKLVAYHGKEMVDKFYTHL